LQTFAFASLTRFYSCRVTQVVDVTFGCNFGLGSPVWICATIPREVAAIRVAETLHVRLR
jgi:hypothetical protein